MQKNYKIKILSIVLLSCVFHLQAQVNTTYKDIILDGKPAKLNEVTGEIKLVESEVKDIINITENNENNSDESLNYHTVAAGENLLLISEQYGLTLSKIKEANNLKTTLISVGQKLRVRNINKVNKFYPADVWVVSKGHTLYHISKKTGVSIETIKHLNGLKNNVISIGQKLYLK